MGVISAVNSKDTLLVALVINLLGFSLTTQAADPLPKVKTKPNKTTIRGAIEAPMDLYTNQPIINVMINGKGPYRLAIDTGSRYTILDNDLFRPIKARHWREVKFGGDDPNLVIGIESFSINGAVFSGFEALLVDYDEIYDGKRPKDGTIGFEMFVDTLLTLDYPSQRVILEKGEPLTADGRETFRYKDVDGLAAIPFQFRVTTIDTIIGSGTVSAFALAEPWKGKVLLEGARRRRNSNALENILPRQARSTITFGHYALTQPPIHFYGLESFVGYEVLKNFTISFDQKNKLVRFQREGSKTIDFTKSPRFGMVIIWKSNKYVVEKVIPGSVAATKVGVREGDVLTNLNGKAAQQYDEVELHNILETADSIYLKMERIKGIPYIFQLRASDVK